MSEIWNEFPVETISEGKVKVVVPNLKAYGVSPSDYAPSRAPVFFNPIMEFNRDLSVLVLQVYQRMVNREISICEPLTATGLRGIRFAAEIAGIKRVISNDINETSTRLASHNIALNNLQDHVSVKHQDANRLLSEHGSRKTRFDVIDIDPFGTPIPYLESALQALRNKGLLATTATDMAPLCGVHSKACIRKYGGRPLRTEYCHELAVRFLTGALAITAAKHDIGVSVLFSHCSDHYIRVYVQINYGCQKADESLRNMGYVLHCFNCLHRETTIKPFPDSAANCPECGAKMDYAGPIWLGKIADTKFTEALINENLHNAFRNSDKITKLLSVIKGEADLPPTYYVLDKISGKLGLPTPSTEAFFHALGAAEFNAATTHFNRRGVRTNAPAHVMSEIMRKITVFQS